MGGGIYENDEFYDLCDEKGVLVWQDFMFACAMTPEWEAHLQNIQAEINDNVKRLRHHPSLALWCGNNENMENWFVNSWAKEYKVSKQDSVRLMKTYLNIFYEMIPQALKKHDPSRPYWPSSPGSGYEYSEKSNDIAGDFHNWWIWFGKGTFQEISKTPKRFVSEYGLQSFPEMKTIKSIARSEDMEYDSPLFDIKQRSIMREQRDEKGNVLNGNDRILDYIKMYYKPPVDFKDFVYLSQLMQAEGLRQVIENHRSHKPYSWGTMYWQLNDCWPTVSWSTIDYYYRWKAAHYFVKKTYEQVLVSPLYENDKVTIRMVSDDLKDMNTVVKYIISNFEGKELVNGSVNALIKANGSQVVLEKPSRDLLPMEAPLNSIYMKVEVTEGGKLIAHNILYFALPKDLVLPSANVKKALKKVSPNTYELTLSTDKLAKNVHLSSEAEEIFFSDDYMDILPGKSIKITITTKEEITAEKISLKMLN